MMMMIMMISWLRIMIVRSRGMMNTVTIVFWLAQVTAAGCRQFEAVNMQTLLVCVSQKSYKVVLLQTGGMIVRIYKGAGCLWVHALLQPLGLRVLLIASPVSFGIVLIR